VHRPNRRRRRFTRGDAEANIGWLGDDALIDLEESPHTRGVVPWMPPARSSYAGTPNDGVQP